MIAALLLVLSLPDGDPALPVGMALEEPVARVQIVGGESDRMRFGISLSAQARVSVPLGAADRGDTFVAGNVVVITNRLNYLDLFSPGLGFTLEADFMSRPPPPAPGGPPW